MVRETSAPEPTVISVISFGRGTGVRSGLSIVQLRAIVGIVGGSWVERDNNKRLSRLINRITSVKHRTGSLTNKATWRNGSAFGFDCRRHQKVAGSSPAVVIFYLFFLRQLWVQVISLIARDDEGDKSGCHSHHDHGIIQGILSTFFQPSRTSFLGCS